MICMSGFLYTFYTLAEGAISVKTIVWLMLKVSLLVPTSRRWKLTRL
jgi:hypothetical protein